MLFCAVTCFCFSTCVQSTVYNCSDGQKHHNKGGFVLRPSLHVELDVSDTRSLNLSSAVSFCWLVCRGIARNPCLRGSKTYRAFFTTTHSHYHFMAVFPGPPSELVPEEIFFWTLWCKGRYQRQTQTNNPVGHHSIQTNQRPTSLISHFHVAAMCPHGRHVAVTFRITLNHPSTAAMRLMSNYFDHLSSLDMPT